MRRGTRVGQAYVAVTADGSGINEEIVDSVDAAGKDIDDKGREHGDKYGEGFSDGFLDRIRNKTSARLSKVMDGKTLGGRAGDEAGESFVDRITTKVREVGDKIGDEIGDRLASKPEAVRRGVDRAFSDDMADRVGTRFAHQFLDSLEARIGDGKSQIGQAFARLTTKAVSGNGGAKKDKTFGDMIGNLFGAGSRNNFINSFGKTMGGVVSLVEKGAGFASKFAEGFKEAGDGASFIQKVMSGFGGSGAGLSSIAVSAPVAAAALGAVLLVMAAMVSVVGALVAILTALVSTIASALVGAIAVALPLLGALAVAGGLVVNAFTSMTNAQKDYLFSAFQPFKAALTGIGQIIMQEFTRPLYNGRSAIQVWSANLQQALVPVAGVAKATAGAFAEAGNIITGAFSGPGFQRLFTSLGVYLPNIIVKLSRAFDGFLNGVAGVFSAIMPFVSRFADYLSRVAERFSAWANSARGQNAITDFVNRALNSLKALWGFIKEVGGLFSDVFFNSSSQNAGNSIFDSMTEAVHRMREAIRRATENGQLRKWLNDGIKFGGKLWQIIVAVYNIFLALYNSGVLEGIGKAIQFIADTINITSQALAPLIDALGWALPNVLGAVMAPLNILYEGIRKIGDAVMWVLDLIGVANQAAGTATAAASGSAPVYGPWAPGTAGNPMPYLPPLPEVSLPDLTAAGNYALNNTYESAGGYMPDPTSPSSGTKKPPKKPGQIEASEWMNPFMDYIDSLQQNGPRLRAEIKAAAQDARKALREAIKEANESLANVLKDTGKTIIEALTQASQSTDALAVVDSFRATMEQVIAAAGQAAQDASASAQQILDQAQSSADSILSSAQQGVDAALSRLGSASNDREARAAMRELNAAQRNYDLAQRKANDIMANAHAQVDALLQNAQATQDRMNAARGILDAQSVINTGEVANLVAGYGSTTATLADYAYARSIVLDKLDQANQRLTEAIALRDNYASSVTESIKTFGALTSAQAKTLNGVAQSLTVTDITDNLRDRLNKVRTFQENLRQLLAMGLSQDAYKQLVDAGVETGGAFAQAILDGGQGGVSEVNDLTQQINDAASGLGDAAASQMYDAGVAAAQGLVDGLNSLATELETAATALGLAIAQAIRDALGIQSPSRVLIADMEHVGDGAVIGLDAQRGKVQAASNRLAEAIAPSPEVAAYAARQQAVDGAVSGNGESDAKWVWNGDIVTPTEDPEAVAHEVLNELTGRLP